MSQVRACGFGVDATKGGGLPLSIEKRALGKKVTIISNVTGNAAGLCKTLLSVLGVGGTWHHKGRNSEIEVQGEQIERVSKVLLQLGCVKGLAKTKDTAAHVVETESDALSGVFGRGQAERKKPRHGANRPGFEQPPDDAPCRKWHGFWPYCRGVCDGPKRDLFLDVFYSEDPSPLGKSNPAQTGWSGSRQALHAGSSGFDNALYKLGLLSQTGFALSEWYAQQDKQKAVAIQRRLAPVPAPTAKGQKMPATDGSFECKECGSIFGTMATLKKHLANHKRDRQGGFSVPAAVPDANWRKDMLAQAACDAEWDRPVAAPNYQKWKQDVDVWDWSAEEYGLCESQAATATTTADLSSYIGAAVIRSKPAKTPKKVGKDAVANASTKNTGNTNKGQNAPCPICGKVFSVAHMDLHIDVCLNSTAAEDASFCASFTVPSSSCGSPAAVSSPSEPEDPEGELLPQDFLECFLEMDFRPVAAELFWKQYEARVRDGMKPRESFVAALEEALMLQDNMGDVEIGDDDPFSYDPQATSATDADNRRDQSQTAAKDEAIETARVAMAATSCAPPHHSCLDPVYSPRSSVSNLSGYSANEQGQELGRWNRARGTKKPKAKAPPPPPPPPPPLGPVWGDRQAPWPNRGTDEVNRSAAKAEPTSSSVFSGNRPAVKASSTSSSVVSGNRNNYAPAPRPKAGTYAEATDPILAEVKVTSAWLLDVLTPVLGVDSAEGVSISIDLVLSGYSSDPDALDNARELLLVELACCGEAGVAGLIFEEFEARLAKLRGN